MVDKQTIYCCGLCVCAFCSFDLYISVRSFVIRSRNNATNRTRVGHGGRARWPVVFCRCEQLSETTQLAGYSLTSVVAAVVDGAIIDSTPALAVNLTAVPLLSSRAPLRLVAGTRVGPRAGTTKKPNSWRRHQKLSVVVPEAECRRRTPAPPPPPYDAAFSYF